MKTLHIVLLACVVMGGLVKGLVRRPQEKCIQVFYDERASVGPLHKLLQSYADYKVFSEKISDYESGVFERCQASLIVSTVNDHKVPKSMLEDFLSTERNVTWLGYNIWQLGDHLEKAVGLRYLGQSLMREPLKRELFYRGKILREETAGLNAQLEFVPLNKTKVEILVEARNHGTQELNPYLIRAKNIFYMADVSFGPLFKEFLVEFIGAPPRGTRKLQQLGSIGEL